MCKKDTGLHAWMCMSCAVCVQARLSTRLAVCSRQCVLAAGVLVGVLADGVWIPVGITADGSTFLFLEAAWPCRCLWAAAPASCSWR